MGYVDYVKQRPEEFQKCAEFGGFVTDPIAPFDFRVNKKGCEEATGCKLHTLKNNTSKVITERCVEDKKEDPEKSPNLPCDHFGDCDDLKLTKALQYENHPLRRAIFDSQFTENSGIGWKVAFVMAGGVFVCWVVGMWYHTRCSDRPNRSTSPDSSEDPEDPEAANTENVDEPEEDAGEPTAESTRTLDLSTQQ